MLKTQEYLNKKLLHRKLLLVENGKSRLMAIQQYNEDSDTWRFITNITKDNLALLKDEGFTKKDLLSYRG